MHKTATVAVIAAMFISACASSNGPPPTETQDTQRLTKLTSVQQWKVISSDVTAQIITDLKARNLASAPLWVPADPKASTFNRVFASELRSELTRKNVSVSATPDAALGVEVFVDEVQHLPVRGYRPGTVTLLTAGVLALRQIGLGAVDPVGGTAVAGLAADAALSAHAMAEMPSTEIVVTTSIKNLNRSEYVMHRTDIYYVDESDRGLYADSSEQREIKVVGYRQ